MRSRKIKAAQKNKPTIQREREPMPRKYVFFTAICSLLLVGGFFGAARQHFASIDYGIKNAKLKRQVEELKSEQRRLQLNKEVALSPSEIKRSAKKIGFTEMTANNIQSFKAERISLTDSGESLPAEISLNRPVDEFENKNQIKPTVSQKPALESKKVESTEEKLKKS